MNTMNANQYRKFDFYEIVTAVINRSNRRHTAAKIEPDINSADYVFSLFPELEAHYITWHCRPVIAFIDGRFEATWSELDLLIEHIVAVFNATATKIRVENIKSIMFEMAKARQRERQNTSCQVSASDQDVPSNFVADNLTARIKIPESSILKNLGHKLVLKDDEKANEEATASFISDLINGFEATDDENGQASGSIAGDPARYIHQRHPSDMHTPSLVRHSLSYVNRNKDDESNEAITADDVRMYYEHVVFNSDQSRDVVMWGSLATSYLQYITEDMEYDLNLSMKLLSYKYWLNVPKCFTQKNCEKLKEFYLLPPETRTIIQEVMSDLVEATATADLETIKRQMAA